jgi:hypothetical protein
VTLIAAFRTRDGVAICADSQETIGDFRQTVQKIAPLSVAGYQLVIAGSGDADPIEGFIIRAQRRFSQESLSPTTERALFLLEDELALFYSHDLAPEQSMKLFIAVSCPEAKEYKVWVSCQHILKELSDVELIGWEHPLYKLTATRMYRPNMSLQQAVIAAVNVLVIGAESSNYIKGPFSLAIIRENGIWIETEEYINTLRDRLSKFEAYTNQILLACADTSIYSRELHKALANFAVTAQKMHEEQVDEAIEKNAKHGFQINDPLSKVPPGILVEVGSDGKRRVRHDVNGIEEMCRRINEATESQSRDEDVKEAEA